MDSHGDRLGAAVASHDGRVGERNDRGGQYHPAEQVRGTRGHEYEDEQPRCDVADALDPQIGAGGWLAEVWLHTVAGGRDARRDDEPCADEDDARGDESGE